MLDETAELMAELRDPRFTPRLAMQLEAMLTYLEKNGLTCFGGAGPAMWWLAEQIREDRFRYAVERNELQLRTTRTICQIVGTRLPRPPRWDYQAVISYVWQLWDQRLPPDQPRTLPAFPPLPRIHPMVKAALDHLIKEIMQ